MKISEVINKLQEIQKEYGDIEIRYNYCRPFQVENLCVCGECLFIK